MLWGLSFGWARACGLVVGSVKEGVGRGEGGWGSVASEHPLV